MTPLKIVEVARLSDVGRVRDHNEDRFLAESALIAVADGMGGAQAGEVAAQMAVTAISAVAAPLRARAVRAAVEKANRDIRERAGEDPDMAGMGTTVTAAMLDDGRLSVVHVGDSRAYLWRDGALRQLTDDHSVVGELVRRGSLSPEEAETHPHRNVITRALGADPDVQVDMVAEDPLAGDVVLLCSDGLSSYVSDADIASDLAGAESLDAAARLLVDHANAAGGPDNVTVVLARLGEDDGAVGETREMRAARSDTAEIPVIRPSSGGRLEADAAAAQPGARRARVLEPVGRRRSRLRPALIAGAFALVVVVGGLAWIGSRTYTLAEGANGNVWVEHGLPIDIAGLDLSSSWQDTGVPAGTVPASTLESNAFGDGWRGEGEAVRVAAGLAWRHGLPAIPPLELAPTPPEAPPPVPPSAAPATPAATTPGS